MSSIEALILPGRPQVSGAVVGALRLCERAAIALHRGGIDRVIVSPSCEIDPAALIRLAASGIAIRRGDDRPLGTLGAARGLIVVSSDVVFEPDAVRVLIEQLDRRGWSGAAASNPSPGTFALLSPEKADDLRGASEEEIRQTIDELRVFALERVFCRLLWRRREGSALEREYIRHRNGKEGVFTRAIRVFSVPTSQVLLRLRVSANHTTLLGLALALASAVLFSHRAYWPGIAGALAYYASMVLDGSDGEVARATLTDSKFGAWLETWTDYLSYFLVMGGLVAGEIRAHANCAHLPAAAVAAAASLAIVGIVGYLRGRVAATNPGAFDDALANEFRNGTTIQRFAMWGRQLIKRSFLAHLIVFQAVIGHLPALLYVWAYGSVGALAVLLSVQSGLIRRVKVVPLRVTATFRAVEE